MSASLVGSEMCIRDRAGHPLPPRGRARGAACSCQRGRGRRGIAGLSSGACLLYTSDAADDM
eukprot:15222348-Alexandrium_andersonii.AAC.1